MIGHLIGVMGRKRAGKDSVAQALMANGGYHRFAFADPLKEMAYNVDPYVFVGADPSIVDGERLWIRLSDLIEKVGWEEAKDNADVRRFLQRLGKEGVRDVLGEDTWVDKTLNDYVIPALNVGTSIVVPDVRFLNEVQAIRRLGGDIWRVDRPDLPPDKDMHASEQAWRRVKPDVVITNDGTMLDLYNQVKRARNLIRS